MNTYFPNAISINEAISLQTQLAEDVLLDDSFSADPKTIGGAAIYSRGNNVSVGLCAYDVATQKVKEKVVEHQRVTFQALPGCEGFREGKILAEAIKHFEDVDIYLINGHGINHPRRLGIASHVGVALDMPTIGASLQLICGQIVEEDGFKYIFENGEKVGAVVRKQFGGPEIFVSPGHKVSISSAARIVEKVTRSRMPEPIRLAQEELVAELKKKLHPM